MAWNVFVVGHDDLSRRLLPTLRHAEDYAFHGLLPLDEAVHAQEYHFDRLVADALDELERFPGSVDAIVGVWDFPTTALLPVLRDALGHRGPSLEAVLKCEHKYWSRLEQSKAVPECVPAFQALDPFDEHAIDTLEVDYPFWIKPVKAHSSQLGFHIADERQLREALPLIRKGIGRFGEPLSEVCRHLDLPDEVAGIDGHHCVVEQIISAGRQCTLEGYVQDGRVEVTGIVDSVRDRQHRSVLMRYEYPSALPDPVQARIIELSRRVMTHIGYDDAPFNIEFYHEEESDRLWLLEINARLSRSHAAIFQLVDGAPHFQVMVDVALGIPPRMPFREGRYAVAAKQMLRVFENGIVRRIPTAEEIERVETAHPGTLVELNVREGMRLTELLHQDSFSWELGVLFTGAEDRDALRRRIRDCQDALPFEIASLSSDGEE
ncbi:acetyl-CoA carboxylase biotin carboxylase subunit family protein [Halomonas beimenensis]|uniref:Acetyl/propionyl-CoA carboxylase, alpha subunit n=1 Tax=Halomonas beimenensis TaxID=475662 RepID=A0A291P8Q0_9GAMM|nr:ATP-grasp domain-containing protein [Halomonas beimenensis]ATJ83231.1 acetyl/propionyl-CoA carboxylase, alpha subunit [Halomonas beimenensis]